MQVRQHDAPDVCRAEAHRPKLRAKFLFRLDVEADAQAKVRMPVRQALHGRGGAGIDQDHAVAMLDRVGDNRQPGRPFRVDQRREAALKAVASSDDWPALIRTRPV